MPAIRPVVRGFYDERTFSIQYVAACPNTGRCAIIDPVLDFDEKSGATATISADAILDYVKEEGLTVEWILDTHPHADHFSAAQYLKTATGAPTAIGARVRDVQALWSQIYAWPELPCDGSQWDRLFEAEDVFRVGDVEARILFSPGHTLASITYLVGDAAFVHDTLFMPDSGTARADFPGGNAGRLYQSIEDILALRRRRAFSSATTIAKAAARSNGKARWATRGARMSTSQIHRPATSSLQFARLGIDRCRCRASSFTRCRSISRPDVYPKLMQRDGAF